MNDPSVCTPNALQLLCHTAATYNNLTAGYRDLDVQAFWQEALDDERRASDSFNAGMEAHLRRCNRHKANCVLVGVVPLPPTCHAKYHFLSWFACPIICWPFPIVKVLLVSSLVPAPCPQPPLSYPNSIVSAGIQASLCSVWAYMHRQTAQMCSPNSEANIIAGRHNNFVSLLLQYNLCDVPLPSDVRNRVNCLLKLHVKAATLRVVTLAVNADILHLHLCTVIHYSSPNVMTWFTSLLWQAVHFETSVLCAPQSDMMLDVARCMHASYAHT